MKKSYLFLLALISYSQFSRAQANISVAAPLYDGFWSALVGPNGMTNSASTPTSIAYTRACYLLTPAEIDRFVLTNSVVTNFGFDIYRPGSVPVNGTLTLYLENTSDVTYSKGTSFPALLTGMLQHYNGNMTIPAGSQNATTSVNTNLQSSFTWTGGSIYVAFDWVTAAPTSTIFQRYLASNAGGGSTMMGAYGYESTGGPAPTTLTLSAVRPQMRFLLGNIATNEASVQEVRAPGFVSKIMNPGHDISAVIRNNSSSTINGVPVTLNVTGANTYNFTQNTGAILPGASTVVVFSGAYAPTNNGMTTLSVSVGADQYPSNDAATAQQSVGCSDYGNSTPTLAASQFTSGGYGYQNPAILATPFKAPSSASITAIKFVAASIASGGSQICGVLLDQGGNIIAQTNTVNLGSGSGGSYTNLKFTPAQDITGGSDYWIGIAQITGATFPFATSALPLATTNLNLFYTVPFGGGSIGQPQNHMGYLGMQGVFSFTNTTIDEVTASKYVACKGDGAGSVTLTAIGGPSSYTWTPGNLQGPTVIVTPSLGTASGTGVVNYNVTGTDGATGCKSAPAVITISVSACTGLAASNTSGGYDIKLYPNPSVGGKATISGLVGTNAITVFNTLGQVVLTQEVAEETTSLDLSDQPAGNYMVKISNANNETRTIKIMNQK